MAIFIINRRLNLQEFRDYVRIYNFSSMPANKLVVHHTWRPTKQGWGGARSIQGLKRYYEGKNWPSGPHLFIAEDGIWLFSPMQKNGIHAGRLNMRSIGIEVVGDYDNEVWSGQTKTNTLGAIKVLMDHLNIQKSDIFFHRDVSAKSCPGHAITKEWLFNELDHFRILPGLPGTTSAMENIMNLSANTPKVTISDKNDVMIPVWAAEAVAWVQKTNLFTIKTEQDVRDAVKFHRFYHLMKQSE